MRRSATMSVEAINRLKAELQTQTSLCRLRELSVRLVFYLYSLSEPEAWEHVFNVAGALAFTAVGVIVFRKKQHGAEGQRSWQWIFSLFLFAYAASFAFG